MFFKALIRIFIVALVMLLSGMKHYAYANPCTLTSAAFIEASRIRGLKAKAKVPCLLHGKEQVRDHLLTIINEKITPARVKYEEIYFKALGIIPQDYDYQDGVVNLYLSQLGGYYDQEKDHYVMAKWLPKSMQYGIAVHELTHALQDQYYDLDKFMDIKNLSSDQLLAHSALIEGDASAVMADYARGLTKQAPIKKDKDVEALILQTVLGASLIAEKSNAPKSLLSLMLFPYTSGLRFAHALLKKGDYKEIDRAFREPPNSTREILHPEVFLNRASAKPTRYQIDDVVGDKAHMVVHSDVVGEFTIAVMLEALGMNGDEASKVASGWLADRLVLLKDKDSKFFTLVWKTLWESDDEAREYLDALDLLKKRTSFLELEKTGVTITATLTDIAGIH